MRNKCSPDFGKDDYQIWENTYFPQSGNQYISKNITVMNFAKNVLFEDFHEIFQVVSFAVADFKGTRSLKTKHIDDSKFRCRMIMTFEIQ